MAITTLFGINGVGKDTIAENLRKKNPEITVSSVSRMLMYILGISKTYDVREKVTEEQYKILESIPQTQMVKIENEEYRRILEKIAKEDKKVIFINHLVTAMRHGEDVQYLTKRLTPDWYIDLNENLIQLVAPSNVIAIRRMNDATRVRSSNIEQIEEHQALCSNEWERIMSRGPEVKQKMHIVDNISLERAVEDVENIAIKEKKNIQIDDDIAELLVRSGCYVNANKTNDKLIKAPNGDIIPAYLSCRLAISDVKTRELLERGLIGRVKQEFKDDVTIAGMATAGIPWAHSIAQKLELPMLYVRSSEKAYGLKGLIEGNLKYASKKAIIVDDVLYTGDTVKKAQEVLKQNGIETVGVACIATLRDKIVNDLTVTSSKEEIIETLGKPTFEDYGIIGYKGKNIYIFFGNDYVSVYRIEEDTDGYDKFLEIQKEFRKEKNVKSLISKLVDLWDDFDKYEVKSNYVNIIYSLRGIKVQINVTNENGFIFYNNYIGKMDDNLDIFNFKELNRELPEYTYVYATKDLVEECEVERATIFEDIIL